MLYPSLDSSAPEIEVTLTKNGVELKFGDISKTFEYNGEELSAPKYTI